MSKADVATRLIPASERPLGLAPLACPTCDRSFLGPERGRRCPACATELECSEVRLPVHDPDELVPLRVDREELSRRLDLFHKRGWLRQRTNPADALAEVAVLVWWPRWLVGATLRSAWSAEVGFNYQAQSTVEYYKKGRWRSIEYTEDRVRWEPRGGTLDRRYEDVQIEALFRAKVPSALLGPEPGAVPFTASGLQHGLILLPDRDPDEVWADVVPAFRDRATTEVMTATMSDHVRSLHLAPTFQEERWNVRLHPSWWIKTGTSKRPRILLVDGVTGRVFGPYYTSMALAWWLSLGIATVAFAVLGLTVVLILAGIVLPLLWLLVPFTGFASMLLFIVAIPPPIAAWFRNRGQRKLLAQLP
ncbi:MAG: hypothetical protein EA397_09470 [Deltaproteobacteria bacterium]|nr:MAG: hypothetical protein EA397_09470 [Deltaproteobacteria bacterium]